MTWFGGLQPEMTPEQRLNQKRLAAKSGYGPKVAADYVKQMRDTLLPLTTWELREMLSVDIGPFKPEDADKAEGITAVIRYLVREELDRRLQEGGG